MKLHSDRRAGLGAVFFCLALMVPKNARARAIVIGDGTPLGCTASAVEYALAVAASDRGSSTIRFACGDEPVTILIALPPFPAPDRLEIPDRTTIDGDGLVTLDGRFLVGPDRSVKIVRLGLTGFGGPGYVGILNYGTLEIRGCAFTDHLGPAIKNKGGTVIVSDSMFARSQFGGRGIESDGTLRVDHSLFVDEGLGSSAGAILSSGILELRNSIFRHNGGDLVGSIRHSGDATIHNCEFTDNVGDFGGALSAYGTLTIKNSTFVGNNGTWGGAIATGATVSISGSEFYDNSATLIGGAIYNCHGSLFLKNTTVRHNSAGGLGGGIWSTPLPALKHTTVSDNTPDDIADAPFPISLCQP